METRQLGGSDLHITPIGFGAWAIGGDDWLFSWGPVDDEQSIATIHRAVDLGMNWIDTAAVYGLGRSEEVVGRALAGRSKRPYIFTKCGLTWNANRTIIPYLKRDSLRNEVEASLRRLQADTIDLYQIHWPNPDEDVEEAWTTLAELKQEGKLRHIGVSNFSVAQMKRAQAIAPITSLQPPYSLINRGAEAEILPWCREQKIGVIVYSPMMSGLLTGAMTKQRVENFAADDWRRRNAEFREPRLTRNLELAELLREIGGRHGRSAGETAIAWTLANPAVTGAIVGGRAPAQMEGIIGAGEFRLSAEEVAEIEGWVRANPSPGQGEVARP